MCLELDRHRILQSTKKDCLVRENFRCDKMTHLKARHHVQERVEMPRTEPQRDVPTPGPAEAPRIDPFNHSKRAPCMT